MKGISLNDAAPLMLTLVTIGFLIGGGLLAMGSFQTTGGTQTAGLENITLDNGTAVQLSYNNIHSVTSAKIAANGTTIPSSAYTVGLLAGTITLTNAAYDGNSSEISYTYYARDAFYNGTQYGKNSITNFSDQLPTVGTILGVAMIIFVALMAFAYIGGRKN